MSVQSREYEEVNATELQSKFHVEHLLGKGAFARVFKAHSLTRPRSNAALKIINSHKVAEQRRNQRRLMASHNSRKCGACSMYSISREENTEELFFPSRADKRARNDSNAQNEIDSEINSVKEMVKREVKVHREASKTRHPHIATLLDSFCYDLPRKIQAAVLVMEFCPLGDLHTYLVKRRRAERDAERGALLPENEARHALRHILRGLSFLHSIGIAHRE
jgi:serine/threonine protein kinase